MRHVLVPLALVLTLAAPARGDEWVTPQAVTVTAPAGRWQATVTPARDGKSGATVTVGARGGREERFTLRSPWMPVDVVLLDDGTLVTFDQWHTLGHGQVAIAYTPQGKVRWSRTLEELVGKARVTTFVRSVSSIWWRPTPLEVTREPGALLVRLRDEHRLRVRLADGHATVVEVARLPDDPVRLANRAEALRNAGQGAEAVALLQRAVALKPDDVPLQIRLVEALQALGRHEQAVAAGTAAARRIKGRHPDMTNVANLHVAIARSQVELKRFPEAEQRLRAAAAAAPAYDYPSLQLAELLWARGRPADVDPVFRELVKWGAGPGMANADYVLLAVGDFYQRHGQLAKARASYAKAHRPDRVTNIFLYRALAETDEKLGDVRAALGVWRQLVARFTALGAPFKADLERAQANVARLERRR
jgi:tetratricopeptide (TPR) repeat protein